MILPEVEPLVQKYPDPYLVLGGEERGHYVMVDDIR
jgi:hypothetical protein